MNIIRKELTENQWNKIKNSFPDRSGKRGRPAKSNRLVVNAILWILRTGAPWRDLLSYYGSWKSVYTRFSLRSKLGLWDKIFSQISRNHDYEYNMIDSTAVKAHQHAAGTKKGKNFNH